MALTLRTTPSDGRCNACLYCSHESSRPDTTLNSRPALLCPTLAALTALVFLYGSVSASAAKADSESGAGQGPALALTAAGSSMAQATFWPSAESVIWHSGQNTAPVVRQIHVAVDGDDQRGDGAATRPFASLERARDEIRHWRQKNPAVEGVTEVVFGPGEYPVTETIRLGERDAGQKQAPIIYRAQEKGETILYGGRRISGFQPITEPSILERLPEAARGKVLKADLHGLGIEDFGALTVRGGIGQGPSPPALELYFNGEPMTVARWPNEVFIRIAELVDPGDVAEGRPSVIRYEDDRHERWLHAEDPWLFGFFHFLWADATIGVAHIDPKNRTLTTRAPYNYDGRAMSDGQGIIYYAFNLLEEIDQPGEWYLNRETGLLYFYPPSDPEEAVVEIGMLSEPLLHLENTAHLHFEGLVFDLARHNGVLVKNSADIVFTGCTIRRMAGNGIMMHGGQRNTLAGCDIHTIGRRGVEISGGDRASLTPGNHLVENCRIHAFGRIDRTYVPAIQLSGVGHRVAHNLMYDAPSSVLMVSGNDHLIEYNEIHSAVTVSDDQGAIDMHGNGGFRGNIFQYNYFHQIGKAGDEPAGHGQAAIRFDDAISGQFVFGNIFHRASNGNFGAVQIHAGRDNIIENNIFHDGMIGVSGGWSPRNPHWQRLKDGELGSYHESALYRSRYPEIQRTFDEGGGNYVWRNLFVRNGRTLSPRYGGHENDLHSLFNWVSGDDDPDPFVDAAGGDFRMREHVVLPEGMRFKPIPFDRIGLYEHPMRASWPVESPPIELREGRLD
jgi:hypothetical protein